jgi:hypothetical protein
VRLAPRVRTGAKLVMGTPRDFNAQLIARRQASPVLRPSEPCSFHPFKSLVSSFVLRGFGQLQAVVGVLSISVRLPYQFFSFVRSTRSPRNSDGPLVRVASPLGSFFGRRSGIDNLFDSLCCQLVRAMSPHSRWLFSFRPDREPSSTRRRMASERLASWSLPYATTCLVKLAGRRTALTGSIPPCFVGRPRDFLFTGIDFFIFSANRNCEPRGSANFRPGTNQATHESNPMAFAEKHDISLD